MIAPESSTHTLLFKHTRKLTEIKNKKKRTNPATATTKKPNQRMTETSAEQAELEMVTNFANTTAKDSTIPLPVVCIDDNKHGIVLNMKRLCLAERTDKTPCPLFPDTC